MISWERRDFQSKAETDHAVYFAGREEDRGSVTWSWFVVAQLGARIGYGRAPTREAAEQACILAMESWLDSELEALAALKIDTGG